MVLVEVPKVHAAGAKARPLFCGTYGTTEVVPCYKVMEMLHENESFRGLGSPALIVGYLLQPSTALRAGCEGVPFQNSRYGRLEQGIILRFRSSLRG